MHDLTREDAANSAQLTIDYIAYNARLASVLAKKIQKNTAVIDVWNKSDMVSADVVAGLPGTGVPISAKTGAGLPALRQRLLQVIGWHATPEGVFMARERHVTALRQVQIQLAAALEQMHAPRPALDLLAEDLRQAQLHLSAITGTFSANDLLGEIFSSFCIGK